MNRLTSINPALSAAAIMFSMVAPLASASTPAVTLPEPRRDSVVGAFSDAALRVAAGLESDAEPIYLIPVGRPR